MKCSTKVLLLVVLSASSCLNLSAQSKTIDSVKELLKTEKNKEKLVRFNIRLAMEYLSVNPALSKEYGKAAVKLAASGGVNKATAGDAWNVFGNSYYVQGDYDSAGLAYQKSIPFYTGDSLTRLNLANAYSNIGLISINKGKYTEGLSWQFKALALNDSAKSIRGSLRCYNAIAVVYSELGELTQNPAEFSNALLYFRKCLSLSLQVNDSTGYSNVLMNIGSVYNRNKNQDSALIYFIKSAEISDRRNDKITFSSALVNIADVYHKKGANKEAKTKALEALKLKTEIGDQLGECEVRILLAELYKKEGLKMQSQREFEAAYQLAKKIGAAQSQSRTARYLSQLHAANGNYADAWFMINDYLRLNDSLSSQQNLQIMQEMKARFDDENQKKRIELLTQQNKIAELTAARQRQLLTFSIGGVLLLLLLAALIYRSLRLKKQANESLQHAYGIIEERNKSITDSLHYASHLQQAILPSAEVINSLLPESFFLYLPKDIVAGDFYWVEEEAGLIFFAAADCTGHGVPGAMVSVVCSKALDTAVHELKLNDPGQILDTATEIVLNTFARTSAEINDGMDISLCVWNQKTGTLQWAGANSPLLLIADKNEPQLIAPDKQPVGRTVKRKNFTTHTFSITDTAQIYLYSDGFGDQFGGEKGKKLRQKTLQELLVRYHKFETDLQKENIRNFFMEWKGELEQIDDVLVAGIKLNVE